MSSASIRAKIKKGLAKSGSKTGSSNSDIVYLVKTTVTAGTPLTPGVSTTVKTELKNAIFKNYDAKLVDINILAGDRQLVCDNVTAIKQGDVIEQGTSKYLVISVDIKAPKSDVLAYIPQLRLK
jgi:hypothetical protein